MESLSSVDLAGTKHSTSATSHDKSKKLKLSSPLELYAGTHSRTYLIDSVSEPSSHHEGMEEVIVEESDHDSTGG